MARTVLCLGVFILQSLAVATAFSGCGLPLRAASAGRAAGICRRVSMKNEDFDVPDTKQVASALGGILGNLKSGRGLFGEEATQKFARTALDTVETQLKEVSDEIKAGEGATAVKSGDKAKRMS
ncbi:hypothetical protein GUITHDRAFT_152020, partial [Guillardia theta CCMP2712]